MLAVDLFDQQCEISSSWACPHIFGNIERSRNSVGEMPLKRLSCLGNTCNVGQSHVPFMQLQSSHQTLGEPRNIDKFVVCW